MESSSVSNGAESHASPRHFVSLLRPIAPDKPLVCKCKGEQHPVDVCPKLTADRDWGDIDKADYVTEEFLEKCVADPPALSPKLISKENLFAWVPGQFNGRRSNENAVSRSIIGLDFDYVADKDAFLARLRGLGLRAYAHASFTVRNPDDTWRIRVYIFLDRPATPEEWDSRVDPWIRATFPEIDEQTLDIARLFFFPVGVLGYWYELIHGTALALDSLPVVAAAVRAKKSNSSTNSLSTEKEEEPPSLKKVPQAKREEDAAAYIRNVPKEAKRNDKGEVTGDGSNQLARICAVVTRGFGCGVEGAVRVISEAPIGDDWGDDEIRRRCKDANRSRKRELGKNYKPNPLQEDFAESGYSIGD
jgi:hypothetical protein